MVTKENFDVFIAYHGTESKSGSMEKAREIYNLLTKNGINCFFNPHSNSGGAFVNTPIIARHCKLFLLVANKSIKVDKWGEISDDTPGLYNEIMGFYNLFFEKKGVRAGSARVFCYGGLTAERANNLHILFNGTAHFEEPSDGIAKLVEWITTVLEKDSKNKKISQENLKSTPMGSLSAQNDLKKEDKNSVRIEAGVLKAYSGSEKIVTLPDGITAIDDYAFIGNPNIVEVHLPESVAVIGVHAFAVCNNLTLVRGSGVTVIQKSAFSECAKLEDVIFSDKLERVGASAFYGCKSLTRLVLHKKLKEIGSDAFANCFSLTLFSELDSAPSTYEENWNGARPVMWLGKDKAKLGTEDSDRGAGYTGVAKGTTTATVVKEVKVPPKAVEMPTSTLNGTFVKDGVTFVVEKGRLKKCLGYSDTVVIPEGVTTIGRVVFSNSKFVKNFYFPSTLKEVENDVFSHCESVTEMVFPNGLLSIGDRAFLGCTALKNIYLGNSLQTLGKSIFTSCTVLEKVHFPKSLTKTGETLFLLCHKLHVYCEVTNKPSGWDDSWNKYNKPVKWGCTLEIRSLPDPKLVSDSDSGRLDKKESIAKTSVAPKITFTSPSKSSAGTSYEIPSNFTGTKVLGGVTYTVKEGVLVGMKGAGAEVVIPVGIRAIEKGVVSFSPVKSVKVPNTVERIEADAFAYCENIRELILPDSVKFIGDRAFLKCTSLEKLYLGDGIERLGKSVFTSCANLPEIYFPKSLQFVGETLFLSCPKLTVYCEVFEQPDGWHKDWNKYKKPVVWGEDY